jgi:hypothetical protein
MNAFIWTLVIGMAVAFVIELINNTLGNWVWWLSPRVVRLWLTIPFAFGASWLIGLAWDELVVVTLASGFFSNALLILLNRATIVSIKR